MSERTLKKDIEEIIDLHIESHINDENAGKANALRRIKGKIADHTLRYGDEILYALLKHGVKPHREE